MDDHSHDGPATDVSAAVAVADDLFFVCGADGTFELWNPAVGEVTGLSDAALETRRLPDVVADRDAPLVEEALADAADDGSTTVEVAIPTTDGDGVPYELQLTSRDDGDRIVGVGRDVTDRGDAADHWSPLDRMTDAFFAVDEDWRLTYVNEQAAPILAAAMDREAEDGDLTGLHFWEEIPEAVDTPFYDAYTGAMDDQEMRSITEYYEPLDTWFEVRAYPSETGLSVYFRDVTEQRRRRQRLREREETLREIYRVTADTDRSFSEQVAGLLEIGCETLDTTYGTLSRIEGDDYHFEVVHSPDDSVQAGDVAPLAATNCERTAARRETLVIANLPRDAPSLTEKTGYEEWGIACYLGAPVVVEGEVYGTFCFYGDEPRSEEFSEWEVTLVDLMSQWVSYELTHRHIRDRLRRQNERLEQFASIVSHDLKNPLNVLSGALELAEQTGEQSHFQQCTDAIERMETLVDDLLTLARTGEELSELEPVPLSRVASDAWDTVATGDATLSVDAEATILADETRLRQLLENCFGNSVEHGGDVVTVTVGELDGGFYVADDGPGIPESERADVFDAGYTTADGGSGFGLSIVRQVAQAHDWSVTLAESDSGGVRLEFTGVERPRQSPVHDP